MTLAETIAKLKEIEKHLGSDAPVVVLQWKGMQTHEVTNISFGSNEVVNLNVLGTDWKEC